MTDQSATIKIGDKSANLSVKSGTIGPDVIDIGALYKNTGSFTYDPGFTSTASCESKITYIDGDEGVLLHRGYPIEQLAEHGDFLEVCYLLLYGELPTAAQKKDFDYRVTHHTMGMKLDIVIKRHLRTDIGEGTDGHVLTDDGAVFNDGHRVNAGAFGNRTHDRSALAGRRCRA